MDTQKRERLAMIITENGITTEYGVMHTISPRMTLDMVAEMRKIESDKEAMKFVKELLSVLENEHLYEIWSEIN